MRSQAAEEVSTCRLCPDKFIKQFVMKGRKQHINGVKASVDAPGWLHYIFMVKGGIR